MTKAPNADAAKSAGWYATHCLPVFPLHSAPGGVCSCGDLESRAVRPRDTSAHGIRFDLDSATKSTRLMSCGANSGRGRLDCAPLLVNG
jgi:hypothetical protein